MIIDDGSTDGTKELVRTWQTSRSFPIRYFWQANAGRHIAFNRGVQEARGAYCAVIDSDDWYPPDALARMIEQWNSIPAEAREDFANVEGLCAFPDGRPVGPGRMPQKVLDSDNFSIIARHRVLGDKMGMYRTAVLREFPFPSIQGQYVTEDVVFLQIANRYSSRFVDEVWGFKEYQAGGITEAVDADAQSFALGFRLSNKALIALDRPKPVMVLLKGYVNFTRYSLHAAIGLRKQISEAPRPLLWLATAPLGFLLYLRDSVRARTR